MAALDFSKKLWRISQQGMVKGVCAGIAQYLDVPVKLVRIITVLAMIFGLFFFVVVAYIILTFALDPIPESELNGEKVPSSGELLAEADRETPTPLRAWAQARQQVRPGARSRRPTSLWGTRNTWSSRSPPCPTRRISRRR